MRDESESVFLFDLAKHLKKFKYDKDAALAYGMTQSQLCEVKAGTRPPNQALLNAMGYEMKRTRVYRKADEPIKIKNLQRQNDILFNLVLSLQQKL